MSSLPAIQVSQERPAGRTIQPEPMQRRAEDRPVFSGPLCRRCGGEAERRIGTEWLCALHADLADERSGRCSTCRQVLPLQAEQAEALLAPLGLSRDALHLTPIETRLLLVLARQERVGVARVLDRVWTQHYGEPLVGDQRHLLRVHGARLRAKIEPFGWTLVSHTNEGSYQLVRLSAPEGRHVAAVVARRRLAFALVPDLIRAKLHPGQGGHLFWTGAVQGENGQPTLYVAATQVSVRRWTWEQANGPLPDTMVVRGCRASRTCCALAHLSVSRRGGIGRGAA